MTERYLRSITADYITGVVSACEGIHGSLVLLNGPLGCRFYHSYAFGKNLIRESELWGLRGELQLSDTMDDRLVRSQYFAGTPQIPGSNLRYEDYIFGTGEQLERALRDILAERRYSMTERRQRKKRKIFLSICLDFALTSRVWKEIRRKSGGFWDCAASG